MPNDNGLAVLGVFLEIGSETNEELEKVLSQIDKIIFKGDKTDIAQDLNIEKLLPGFKRFTKILFLIWINLRTTTKNAKD